jgi:hypothetical protein
VEAAVKMIINGIPLLLYHKHPTYLYMNDIQKNEYLYILSVPFAEGEREK